jgi:hypothetical protein
MFGGLNQRMKGGLGRLRQRVSTGITYIISGPPESDLLIEAGRLFNQDRLSNTSARKITIRAGAPSNGGQIGNSVQGGGNVEIFATAGGSYGNGGNVLIQSGDAAGTTLAGDITIQCGQSSSAASGTSAVALIGSNNGSGNGAQIRAEGGLNFSGGNALILGGNAIQNGIPGGAVLIQPGSGNNARSGNINLDGGRGAALATTATAGFVTVPTCAGAPTGVPDVNVGVPTGSVATVVDTTNLRAYFYIAGTWRYAQLV